jgi:hypothetical protein
MTYELFMRRISLSVDPRVMSRKYWRVPLVIEDDISVIQRFLFLKSKRISIAC